MRYVTSVTNKRGRLGHQLKDLLTAKIISIKYDLKYLYSPLRSFAEPWEEFLGFGENEIRYNDKNHSNFSEIIEFKKTDWWGMSLEEIEDKIIEHKNDKTLFKFLNSARVIFDQVDDEITNKIIDELREKYFKKRKEDPINEHFDKNKINIAVHVRRGGSWNDVSQTNNSNRYSIDTFFLNQMNKIASLIKDIDYEFHIYSEGPENELNQFKNLKKTKLHICDNEYPELFSVFHHMLIADILIASKSDFSYILGMMSKKFVIYPISKIIPFKENELHTLTDNKGNFNTKNLEKYLEKIKKEKVSQKTNTLNTMKKQTFLKKIKSFFQYNVNRHPEKS